MENQENKVTSENTENSNSAKSFNPLAVLGVFLLIVLVGFGILSLKRNTTTQPQETQAQGGSTTNSTDSASSVNIKEFTVNGSSFKFEPAEIKVNKGDTVKITFKDNNGTHNLVVDGYNVSTRILSEGTDTIQFIADKAGSFEYYCSIGSHKDLGMKGALIVE